MMRRVDKVGYICNFLSDDIVLRRGFSPSSNAAAAKLSPTIHACRDQGMNVWVVSLGRGRQRGSGRWHSASVCRVRGVPVVFAAFWDVPVLTHLVSLISLGLVMFRLRKRMISVVFWNGILHYFLAFLVAWASPINCILDLEDGERSDCGGVRDRLQARLVRLMARASIGAMIANTQLAGEVNVTPIYCFYGVAPREDVPRCWSGTLNVLFSGYISVATGARQFTQALLMLKTLYPEVLNRFRFIATGSGDLEEEFRSYAAGPLRDCLEYRGRVSDPEYEELLRNCHIGLCLKAPGDPMGQTTFPSKVIQFAAQGLLVISNRVSDVPYLFTPSDAYLLEEPTAEMLSTVFTAISKDPDEARKRAFAGQAMIREKLDPQAVATQLRRIWRVPAKGLNGTDLRYGKPRFEQ